MYQGNWTCSQCNGPITELPFEPRSEKGLTCRACYAQSKNNTTSTPAATDMQTASEPMAEDEVPDFDESQIASEAPDMPEFTGAAPATNGEKPRFTGEWSCSVCNGAITSLPFEPRNTNNLKCIDCFKAGKG